MSALHTAIKQFDGSDEKKEEISFALNLLEELAKAKCDRFKIDVKELHEKARNKENDQLPVQYEIYSHSESRAYKKDSQDNLPNSVSDAVRKFVSGGSDNIINGISNLVTSTLNILLPEGDGQMEEQNIYACYVGDFAVARLDIMLWRKSVEALSISQHIEKCIAYYAVESSIDVEVLDLNTFLLMFEKGLKNIDLNESEIQTERQRAIDMYIQLGGGGGSNPSQG